MAANTPTDDAVQTVVEAVTDPHDKAAIMLAYSAGLQLRELENLKWDDVIDDGESPIKLQVSDANTTARQVLVERKIWHTYVAPLFFASMEGAAAGCTSTPAEPRIFPVLSGKVEKIIEQVAISNQV